MRTGNFDSILCFPHKKDFINEGVDVLFSNVGFIKFFLGVFDDDAWRLESIELGKKRWDFAITLAQTKAGTWMFVDAFSFRII